MTSTTQIAVCLAIVFCFTEAQRPTVNTTLGQLSGRVRLYSNNIVFDFLGIPYAAPPTGRLRFRKPEARKPWTGVLDATRYRAACAQRGLSGSSENCLFLNVHVPRNMTSPAPRAVMLWIHGGGFVFGTGRRFDGAPLALTGDVIVVTINYRLDVFGFLSTGDDQSRGNYGMWDQRMAIQWVKDNIAAFGGDPNKITIFGESGGGYSVGLLAASPQSRGLFQKAICESGTALSPRAIAFDPVSFSRRFSDNLGCTNTTPSGQFNTTFFMNCLRRWRTRGILWSSALARRHKNLVWRLELAPVVDGELIPRHPEFLLSPENRQFYNPMRDIDYMAGTTNAEGSLLLGPLRGFQRSLRFILASGIPTRVFCQNIAPSIANDYFNGSKLVLEAICREYSTPPQTLPKNEQARNAVNMYGDMMFVAPTVRSLTVHNRLNRSRGSYQYLFSRTDSRRGPVWFRGAGHGAEIPYVFGAPVFVPRLSAQMMRYWTNFAKFGNPNGNPETEQPRWPAFRANNTGYVNLDTNIGVHTDLYSRRMKFWISEVPNLLTGTSIRG